MPEEPSSFRRNALEMVMRAGRAAFRNTPLQRLPVTSAIYRRLVRSAYGGDGTTVVTFRGIDIEIAAGDITTLPTLADGSYERAELDRLLALVKPGDTVADIGANIGVYSVLLSRTVGPSGRVIAFEPSPSNARLLESNLTRNGCANVTIVPAAVGPVETRAAFDTDSPGATHGFVAGGSRGDVEVDVVRLDDYASQHGITFDAIKIDIEGYEPEALAGMGNVIARKPTLLLEFSVPQAKVAGASWDRTLPSLLDVYGNALVFDGRSTRTIGLEAVPGLLVSSKLQNLLFTAG